MLKRNIILLNFIIQIILIYVGQIFVVEIEADEPRDNNALTIEIPGNVLWTNTDVEIKAGNYVKFSAIGEVEVTKWSFFGEDGYDYSVGPEGTYNFSDKVATNNFPMPSAKSGPIPCYSLIGKFNDKGNPFFIGKKCSLVALEDGILYLGINDFDVKDNKGNFRVNINVTSKKPEGFDLKDARKIESVVVSETITEKIKNSNVLLIYVDGLNYSVLKEMAFTGYLPNIKKYFFDSGTDFVNTFTTFPSSTFQSASSTLTGMHLDMTGIKQEMFFDREKRSLDHYFKPFGPNTAARIMRPDIWGKINNQRPEPMKLIYDYTADNDLKYASTILPIQHQSPPTQVMKTIANSGYFSAHKVHFNLDKINGDYALEYVINKNNDLMYVWLPGPDVEGHESAIGLWGAGRKRLYLIDKIIGQIMDKLIKEGIFDQTYKMLYSDHGHLGGKYYINQSFDITNELFYKSIIVKDARVSKEGGLGFNVMFAEDDRILRKFHSKSGENYFMVSAVEGFGIVNVYLPYESKYSDNMLDRNNLYNLTNYNVFQDMAPVNILEMVLKVDKSDSNQFPDKVSSKPVDLVLLKLDDNRVLILKSNGSQAIIERKRIDNEMRSFVYRYKVISSVKQFENGMITFDDNTTFKIDPLEYLDDSHFSSIIENEPGWLEKFHSADEWLEATVQSQYPDAVVQFSHFFLWDDSIKDLESRHIPDFVVTANRGWNFRSDGVLSTDHGYPFAETMRIPLIISGPNIKEGVIITQPHRIVDILPTTLSLLNVDYDEDVIDGKSILKVNNYKSIVNSDNGDDQIERYISFPYNYSVPKLKQDELNGKHRDISIHDYDSPYDLHHIAADVKFTLDLSVFKISEDIIDFMIPGNNAKPIESGFDMGINAIDKIPDNLGKRRFLELLDALKIRNFSIADMSVLSGNFANEGNFHRANSLIDWSQNVMGDINKLLGAPIYRFKKGLIPGKHFNKYIIDYPQIALEGVRKNVVEVLGRAVFRSIFGIEYGAGKILNIFRNHKDNTPEKSDDSEIIKTIPLKNQTTMMDSKYQI